MTSMADVEGFTCLLEFTIEEVSFEGTTYWTASAVSFLFGFIINLRADSFFDSDESTMLLHRLPILHISVYFFS